MTTFSFIRIKNFARWDLTINRSFYLRVVAGIFAVLAIPAFFSVVRYLSAFQYGFVPYPQELAAATANNMMGLYRCLLLLFFGYTFHNLLTKQGRINELTLPASNAEKFTWHVLLILFGSAIVAVVSFFVIDLLHYLSIGLCIGFDHAYELASALISIKQSFFDVNEFVLYVLALSTFLLGNALKYRHNVPLTILADICLGFASIIVSLSLVSLFVLNKMEDSTNSYWNIVEKSFAFESDNLNTIVLVILGCLSVVCWAWAYWLYTRATITSKRNR